MNDPVLMFSGGCLVGILFSFFLGIWQDSKTNPGKIELVGGPYDGEILKNRPAITRSFIMIGYNEFEMERYELQEDKAIYSPE